MTRPGGSRRKGAGPRPADASETRRHARFLASLPVRCTRVASRPSRTWRGRTADVGGGGFAVELPTRLPPGTRLAIEVRTGIGPLRMEASVRWTRRIGGPRGLTRHGLRLADGSEVLDLPVGVLLGEWLRGLARREGKSVASGRAPRRPRGGPTTR